MLAEISYDETQQELIFFVGEADYQQELSNRGFETVLQERKFGISATMIRENPSKYWKNIAPALPSSVYKESIDYGECQQWEDHSSQGFGKVLRCTRQFGIRT